MKSMLFGDLIIETSRSFFLQKYVQLLTKKMKKKMVGDDRQGDKYVGQALFISGQIFDCCFNNQ